MAACEIFQRVLNLLKNLVYVPNFDLDAKYRVPFNPGTKGEVNTVNEFNIIGIRWTRMPR